MPSDVDPRFYDRADAHIELSNQQIGASTRGEVSASMLYAVARFNAWVCACGFESGAQMREKKGEMLAYFVEQYAKMLEENFDDYAEHFAGYMQR